MKIIDCTPKCITNSKINSTPQKGVYMFISKLHSISEVPNLLAHNNITISYYVQVNSLRLKPTVVRKWASINACVGTIYFAVDGTLNAYQFYCTSIFRSRHQQQIIQLVWANMRSPHYRRPSTEKPTVIFSRAAFSYGYCSWWQ